MRGAIFPEAICFIVGTAIGIPGALAQVPLIHEGSTKIQQIEDVVADWSESADQAAHAIADGVLLIDDHLVSAGAHDGSANVKSNFGIVLGDPNKTIVVQGLENNQCYDCIGEIIQNGLNNGARIEQYGVSNETLVRQDGNTNYLQSLQNGIGNFIGIDQLYSSNFADISQFGNNHSISITQPGYSSIMITQE